MNKTNKTNKMNKNKKRITRRRKGQKRKGGGEYEDRQKRLSERLSRYFPTEESLTSDKGVRSGRLDEIQVKDRYGNDVTIYKDALIESCNPIVKLPDARGNLIEINKNILVEYCQSFMSPFPYIKIQDIHGTEVEINKDILMNVCKQKELI